VSRRLRKSAISCTLTLYIILFINLIPIRRSKGKKGRSPKKCYLKVRKRILKTSIQGLGSLHLSTVLAVHVSVISEGSSDKRDKYDTLETYSDSTLKFCAYRLNSLINDSASLQSALRGPLVVLLPIWVPPQTASLFKTCSIVLVSGTNSNLGLSSNCSC